jgi:NAD(P)-dependent dehydrogenase (short-subunit alcohol dehydrogenase family)
MLGGAFSINEEPGHANGGRTMRLKDKVAVIIGAGQSAGETLGNGRATVLRFAQEGAKIFAVDRDLASADETADMARAAGGECETARADVMHESELKAAIEAAHKRFGRIDVLHYNVGIAVAGGDAPVTEITEDAFDLISAVNIRGAVMACKHTLPIMREQKSGVILMISSISAWENYPNVAYKVTKAGMIAFTQQLAIRYAEYGIRANAILPGLMATPMAIDVRSRAIGKPHDEIMRERDARVPLRGRQGTAWDVANAALFLASDEANFITGVSLPVDGGMLVDIAPGRRN